MEWKEDGMGYLLVELWSVMFLIGREVGMQTKFEPVFSSFIFAPSNLSLSYTVQWHPGKQPPVTEISLLRASRKNTCLKDFIH